jgi:hypothetical protein
MKSMPGRRRLRAGHRLWIGEWNAELRETWRGNELARFLKPSDAWLKVMPATAAR